MIDEEIGKAVVFIEGERFFFEENQIENLLLKEGTAN